MLFLFLSVPIACIITGILFLRSVPGEPNWVFGFRTRRASSSKEAWRYAQSVSGRYILIAGVAFSVAILITFFALNTIPKEELYDILTNILLGLLCAVIVTAIFVQIDLCRKFDMKGVRR